MKIRLVFLFGFFIMMIQGKTNAEVSTDNGTTSADCISTTEYEFSDYDYGLGQGTYCDDEDNCRRRFIESTSVTTVCTHVIFKSTPLPKNTNEICSSLEITNSTINILPSSSFIHYSSINDLYLINTGIEQITPGAFKSLFSLQYVFLSSNNISVLLEGVFNSLSKLTFLDLSTNCILDIGLHSFTGTKLEELNFSSNALGHFDSNFFQYLPEILTLDLSFNKLITFNFTYTNTLQYLNISNNFINEVVGCFNTLIELNMSRNRIFSLKNITYSRQSSLRKLDVSYNSISDLVVLSNLTELEYLYLENNQIISLPNIAFSKLSNLCFLNVSHNQIEQLQYGLFDHSPNLEVLDISHNNLNSIQRYNFHVHDNLRELYINNNNILTLDAKQLIEHLPRLELVALNNNEFSCEDLVEIIHNFKSKNATVLHGISLNSSNILGIACQKNNLISIGNTNDSFHTNSNIEDMLRSKFIQIFNSDFSKSIMYNYFNKDFKNSNFYKYLENFKNKKNHEFNLNDSAMHDYFNKDFKESQFYKFLENIKYGDISRSDFNKSIYSYFNKDFKNSNFVKYLEDLKKSDNVTLDISNSEMYKYFNKEFKNSNFYRYLENLSCPQCFVKYSSNENETKVEKLISNNGYDYNGIPGLLVAIVVLLIMIVLLLTINLYFKHFKLHVTHNQAAENVELI